MIKQNWIFLIAVFTNILLYILCFQQKTPIIISMRKKNPWTQRTSSINYTIFKVIGKSTNQTYIGGATSLKFQKLRQIFNLTTHIYKDIIIQQKSLNLLQIIGKEEYEIIKLETMNNTATEIMKLKVFELRQSIPNINLKDKPKIYQNGTMYMIENLLNNNIYVCCSEIYTINEIEQRYRDLYKLYKKHEIPYLRCFSITTKKYLNIKILHKFHNLTNNEFQMRFNYFCKKLKSINKPFDIYCDDIIDNIVSRKLNK